ncbi:MAG: hypothetical protein HIU88_06170 [Acidobacteria bacterium]|nr:hypothetical protein [Acidobacteriota bacterium]
MADQGIMTLVAVAVIAVCVSLALFVLYTVIWHAVRRGLREFTHPSAVSPFQSFLHAPLHAPRLTRRGDTRVPDYPPSDWV